MIKITPFPAVRINRKWTHTESAQEYFKKMNDLRLMIWNDKEKLIKLILSWDYQIVFYMKMPENWSGKKKQQMMMSDHKIRPDIDNLYKATIDTLFYNTEFNDKEIFKINCCKCWNNEGWIEFCDSKWNIIR